MGKARRVLRCYNCGVVLQAKKESERGYIDKELFENHAEGQVLYCQKCFDMMKSVNTGALEQNIDKATAKILNDAVATDAFIIWVIDLFTFNGTLNIEIAKKLKNSNIAVIGTHRDLFSSLIKDETLIRFINERFGEYDITPNSVTLLGADDDVDMEDLKQKFNAARRGHDIYIIGSLGSGKTLLINKFLKHYENKTKWPIKTENYRGTNVKVMSIPLSNSSFIYELPGFSLATSVVGKVEKDVQKLITPRKKIETHYRTLGKGDVLAAGSLAFWEHDTNGLSFCRERNPTQTFNGDIVHLVIVLHCIFKEIIISKRCDLFANRT